MIFKIKNKTGIKVKSYDNFYLISKKQQIFAVKGVFPGIGKLDLNIFSSKFNKQTVVTTCFFILKILTKIILQACRGQLSSHDRKLDVPKKNR